MAKKIYFKTINVETVNTINTILDVTFANAFERKELTKELRSLEKKFKEAKEKNEPTLELTKGINVIKNKRDALKKWTDTTLRTHKDSSDNWVDGLFAEIGVDKKFCETYIECRDNETWGKWNSAIKKMLVEVYGMSLDDKLVGKFASFLEHKIGDSATGINQILKGELLKPQTVRNFSEIMVRAIATYIAKTNDDVVIPTAEFYVAKITYDKNIRTVEKYEVVEKTEVEESKESVEVVEEPVVEEKEVKPLEKWTLKELKQHPYVLNNTLGIKVTSRTTKKELIDAINSKFMQDLEQLVLKVESKEEPVEEKVEVVEEPVVEETK